MIESDQQFNFTPKPTPSKSRFYLNSLNPSSLSASASQLFTPASENFTAENQGVIYGTNIKLKQTMRAVKDFLLNFSTTIEKDEEFITQKTYLVKLSDLEEQSTHQDVIHFDIDAKHLFAYSKQLYLQLVYYPMEIISFFDQAVQQLYQQQFIETETNSKTKQLKSAKKQIIVVGIINMLQKDKLKLKDLNPSLLGRLMSITGMVTKMSEIYPQMLSATFRCLRCKTEISVPLYNTRVEEPKVCLKCKSQNTFQLDHNSCQFTSKQLIKFQQLLQNVTEGHSPTSVNILAYDSNVDKIRPGDFIEAIGIYRCHPVQVQRGKIVYRQIFNTYFDLISFQVLENRTKMIRDTRQMFTDEQKKKFHKIAAKNTVIDDLIDSFAPSIYGHREVKRGILAQLMGGTRKQRLHGGSYRSEINVCLLGDPSTAKSQILQQVHKIAPRSVYTCGRGSSAVGLTANVKKDPETQQFVLQSGALVLSNQGICCIDQFDKMQQNTRTVLLQVMEQQTISIAKAGVVCQLNAKTAILAAANPINSKYDAKKSIVENINLPPALLSRFDLLYILLDIPIEAQDKKIAAHILDIYTANPTEKKKESKYSYEVLSKYINYCRTFTFPILSEEAGKKLGDQYKQLRNGGQNKNSINTTPRLLESMIRLSQSFAKMRLSNEVSVEDAQMAIDLISFATLKSATDPDTGVIDMGIITTGKTQSMKRKSRQIALKIKEVLLANQFKYREATSLQNFVDQYNQLNPKEAASKQELLEGLTILSTDDVVYLFGSDKTKKLKFKLKHFDEPT